MSQQLNYTPADYQASVGEKIIEQFKNSSKFTGILDNHAQELTGIDLINKQIYEDTNIFTAINAQLDLIGEFIYVYREGRTDNEYRAAILIKAGIMLQSGQVNTIIDIFALLTGNSQNDISFYEQFPACLSILGKDIDPGLFNSLLANISNLRAAGIEITLGSKASSGVFRHSSLDKAGFPDKMGQQQSGPDQGFGDRADLAQGGPFSIHIGNKSPAPPPPSDPATALYDSVASWAGHQNLLVLNLSSSELLVTIGEVLPAQYQSLLDHITTNKPAGINLIIVGVKGTDGFRFATHARNYYPHSLGRPTPDSTRGLNYDKFIIPIGEV